MKYNEIDLLECGFELNELEKNNKIHTRRYKEQKKLLNNLLKIKKGV